MVVIVMVDAGRSTTIRLWQSRCGFSTEVSSFSMTTKPAADISARLRMQLFQRPLVDPIELILQCLSREALRRTFYLDEQQTAWARLTRLSTPQGGREA